MPTRPSSMRPVSIPASKVPVFQLYGENGQAPAPELIHCESIAERSRLHNWEIRPHRHHGLFQLLWLEEGFASCQLDEARAELEGGTVLLMPQHCVHGFQFSTDASGLVVTVSYSLLGSLAAGLGAELSQLDAPQRFSLQSSDGRVEAALRELKAEYDSDHRFRQALINAQLSTAIGWLLRQSLAARDEALQKEAPVPARARKHLSRFTQLVDTDFSQHASLEYYARQMGISAAHLNALCRQVTGRSALELIHARLMLEARRLLVYTSMTIQEVAEVLGFSDPAYFTRFFKRNAGLSPRDFRRRADDWNAQAGGLSSPFPAADRE